MPIVNALVGFMKHSIADESVEILHGRGYIVLAVPAPRTGNSHSESDKRLSLASSKDHLLGC